MNARLYDPVLHTFLSPDANITDPSNPQNYNRYAYALNNPLMYVDYSGNDPVTVAIVTAAIIGAIIGGVTYVGINLYNGTAITWGGLAKSILVGAISGAASGGIGQIINGANVAICAATQTLTQTQINLILALPQALMHGIAQGIIQGISGGDAGQSFIVAAISSLAGSGFGEIGGKVGKYTNTVLGKSLFGSVAGGVTSRLQGGNFWDGAVIGLTIGLLNHASKPLSKAIDGWLQGKPEINFDKLIAAYPGDENSQISSTAAFTKVGGAVEKFYNEYIIEHPGEVPNACALRESIAFNDSNQNLKYSSGNTYKGADGKNYYLSSEKMASNLPKQFRLNSTTTRNSSLSSFNGSKGIYFMQPKSPAAFGATGHISIWNGNSVLGGHSYADHSQFYQATLFR